MLEGLWEVIYANGKVIIPTLARTKGPWLKVAPVEVLDWADKPGLQARIAAKIRSGNPHSKWRPQLPDQASLASAAGFNSDRRFEERARGWSVEKAGGIYRIVPYKRPARGSGWLVDGDNAVALPPGASEETAAAKVIEIMQSAIR